MCQQVPTQVLLVLLVLLCAHAVMLVLLQVECHERDLGPLRVAAPDIHTVWC
jgi:hypothetical protein